MIFCWYSQYMAIDLIFVSLLTSPQLRRSGGRKRESQLAAYGTTTDALGRSEPRTNETFCRMVRSVPSRGNFTPRVLACSPAEAEKWKRAPGTVLGQKTIIMLDPYYTTATVEPLTFLWRNARQDMALQRSSNERLNTSHWRCCDAAQLAYT
jgi:hypothetical protein